MMSEQQLRDWRQKEKDRLPDIYNPRHKHDCQLTIEIINAVLQEEDMELWE